MHHSSTIVVPPQGRSRGRVSTHGTDALADDRSGHHGIKQDITHSASHEHSPSSACDHTPATADLIAEFSRSIVTAKMATVDVRGWISNLLRMVIGVYLLLPIALCACGAGGSGTSREISPPQPRASTMTNIPTSTVSGEASTCPESEFRPVIMREIRPAEGVTIGSMTLTHCRNGYARVLVTPSPPGSTDNLQVFLRRVGDRWVIVVFGTAICGITEDEMTPEIFAACRALGEH